MLRGVLLADLGVLDEGEGDAEVSSLRDGAFMVTIRFQFPGASAMLEVGSLSAIATGFIYPISLRQVRAGEKKDPEREALSPKARQSHSQARERSMRQPDQRL